MSAVPVPRPDVPGRVQVCDSAEVLPGDEVYVGGLHGWVVARSLHAGDFGAFLASPSGLFALSAEVIVRRLAVATPEEV